MQPDIGLSVMLPLVNACQVHRSRERLQGAEHPDTLRTRVHISKCLWRKGDRQMAADMLQEVITVQRRVLGAEHPGPWSNMGHLALYLLDLGEPQPALDLAMKAYKGLASALGPEHPSTLSCMHNLVNHLAGAGRLQASTLACIPLQLYALVCTGPTPPLHNRPWPDASKEMQKSVRR